MISELSTERKAYYDHLFTHTDPVKTEHGIETSDVPYKSNTEYTRLKVYEIEIGDFKTGLRFNLNNSRILKEKLKKEQEINAQLDPNDENIQRFLQETLLNNDSYSKNATGDLKKDLQATGQLEPAIISCDGVIWNANRRIAIRKELFKETGDPKWSKVKVVVLPKLDLKDLKLLEHRLQMSKSYRENYGPITFRLRCRQAINEDKWDYKELTYSFANGHTEKKIKQFISEIDLIDEYLQRINNKNDYSLVESKDDNKGVEIFSALHHHLVWEQTKNGSDDTETDKIKTIFFSLIMHPETTYEDARALSKVLKDQHTRNIHLINSPIYNNFAEYTTPSENHIEKAFSLNTCKNELKNKHETYAIFEARKNTPLEVADKALTLLTSIKEDRVDRNDNDFSDKLDKIIQHINYLKGIM